jgi:alternative ribosome-rescue factor
MIENQQRVEKDSHKIKRNPISQDLHSQKYRQRVIKPKKGKASYSRKKISA